jgi:hypothetical protein
MIKKRRLWAKILLASLTLCGMYSTYWTLGSVWVMGESHQDPRVWRTRAYIWLTESILIGICWSGLLVWLVCEKSLRDLKARQKQQE